MSRPLFRKIDCLRIPVPDLETGLAFYRDKLGHEMIWRTATAAGLRLPETDAEIVIHTEPEELEIDLLVDSAEAAAARIEQSGGRTVIPPFDIQIGRCVLVEDPFGNQLVLLDMSKGPLVTDQQGNVLGNQNPESSPEPVSGEDDRWTCIGRLREYPETIGDLEAFLDEPGQCFALDGWMWCMRCERAYPVGELRVVKSGPGWSYYEWALECATEGCSGRRPDWYPWHPLELPRALHPEYPATPDAAPTYPLQVPPA